MAISLVGTPQSGNNIDGGDVTLTFSTAPSENDVVVVFGGHPRHAGNDTIGPSTAGYTALATNLSGSGINPTCGVWYKRMGATPDTTVTCQGGANINDGVAYACYVLRGVHKTDAADATTTTANNTTGSADSPSITTVTGGAWVIAIGCSQAFDTNPGTITGYSNTVTNTGNDNSDFTVAAATLEKATAGAEDPPAWSAMAAGSGWFAFTVAIKPANVLVAEAGATGITGTDAALLFNRALAADSGSSQIVGTDATLSKTIVLSATSGATSISGADAGTIASRLISATSDSVVITGTDATLHYAPLGGGGVPLRMLMGVGT